MWRISLLFVMLVVVTNVAAQSQRPTPEIGEQGQTQRSQAQQSPAAKQQPSAIPPIIVNVLPSPKTEAERAEEARARQEKTDLDRRLVEFTADLATYTARLYYATLAVAFATICLVLATAGLAVFAFFQSRDMKASIAAANAAATAAEQANILTRDIFIAEQRPWLRWTIPPIGVLKRNGPRLSIDINGNLENLGRIPASNISYFGKIFAPPPNIAAINFGQLYFSEHMTELQTQGFSLAAILPTETIPMRFTPHGVEINNLPQNFTLFLAFHARYMFAVGAAPNPRAIAEIGTVYMVRPIGKTTIAFEKMG